MFCLVDAGAPIGLAIKKVKEYKQREIPMLPVKVGVIRTSQPVFSLNVLTVAFSLMFPIMHLTSAVFSQLALIAGAMFLFVNGGLLFGVPEACRFKVFLVSMPYLACIMLGLIIDKIEFYGLTIK